MMKRIQYLLLSMLFMIGICTSCIDVVHLDLPPVADRVVFNADIVLTGDSQLDATQAFFLSKVASINDLPQGISGATIVVTDNLGNHFSFLEDSTFTGKYVCNNFKETTATNYSMTAIVEGEQYEASEELLYTPPIDSAKVYLTADDSNFGITLVHLYITDIANEPNRYQITSLVNGEFPINSDYGSPFDDRFQDGKVLEISNGVSDKDAVAGDTLNYTLRSISQTNYNFLSTLQSQSYQASPFAPAPSSVKGNVWNSTDNTHYALGYFRVNNITRLDLVLE